MKQGPVFFIQKHLASIKRMYKFLGPVAQSTAISQRFVKSSSFLCNVSLIMTVFRTTEPYLSHEKKVSFYSLSRSKSLVLDIEQSCWCWLAAFKGIMINVK